MRRLLDANDVAGALDAMAQGIAEELVPESELVLIGVRTRGVPLARRLADRLREARGVELKVGALDITLYRDDLSQVSRWPVLRGTEIPFPVEDRRVVLVDDVLYTGRTAHAAIDAVWDLGRPSLVRLAVLIDRGHRELPIQPDIAGRVIPTAAGDRVNVRLKETDGTDEVILL